MVSSIYKGHHCAANITEFARISFVLNSGITAPIHQFSSAFVGRFLHMSEMFLLTICSQLGFSPKTNNGFKSAKLTDTDDRTPSISLAMCSFQHNTSHNILKTVPSPNRAWAGDAWLILQQSLKPSLKWYDYICITRTSTLIWIIPVARRAF